jgi:hypothetical protein
MSAYSNEVNKTIANIHQFTVEQKFKAIQVLTKAEFSTPVFTAREDGMTVVVRSAFYKKAVIVHIKKTTDSWLDMPFGPDIAKLTRLLAKDDWDCFSSNFRAEMVDGKIATGEVPTAIETAWQHAFNNAVSDFPPNAGMEEKASTVFHDVLKVWAWSCAVYRIFSEVFLAEMESGDEGMTLLLGYKAKVMYRHCEENTKILTDYFGPLMTVKTIVV